MGERWGLMPDDERTAPEDINTSGPRRLGDVARDVIDNVVRLNPSLGEIPNNPVHEFMFEVCEGQPPGRQKRLIMMARHPGVGAISDTDAEILIDALGLKEA